MIAITGGGTGGHIFPIIAVIEELRLKGFKDFIWIGQKGGKEEIWAKRFEVPFIGIPSGKLRRYFSLKNFFDLFRILTGFIRSLMILKKSRIDVLFSKGGFVSVPPVVAAKFCKIPVVTHESDITPGLANRINSRFSKAVFVSFDDTKKYFKNCNVIVTGNPIRKEIKNGNAERGRQFLDKFFRLEKGIPIVLILGGSLGALSINRAVWDLLRKYELDFYLIHQCGPENKNKEFDDKRPDKYLQIEFIDRELGDILNASDLVVSRAGAGAIYEIGYIGKPAIFVPLSLSGSRGEQIKNAQYLKMENAAIVLEDEELSGITLYEKIKGLLAKPNLMKEISNNFKSLIIKNAEEKIAKEILKYV